MVASRRVEPLNACGEDEIDGCVDTEIVVALDEPGPHSERILTANSLGLVPAVRWKRLRTDGPGAGQPGGTMR